MDQRDSRWQLSKILKGFRFLQRKLKDSKKKFYAFKKVRRVVSKHTQLSRIQSIKINLTSMFFSTKISHDVRELKQKKELRRFLGVNWFRKPVKQRNLLDKDYKWDIQPKESS